MANVLPYAQSNPQGVLDSIQVIDVVAVKATVFQELAVLGQKTVSISEDARLRNSTNFTELLRYNSPIVFKDYGRGGVSTARFRGTAATNTLVLWNGININAVGNGQTDFNALSVATADEIIIQSGGAGIRYGSGAIGGVVHINDQLHFEKHDESQIFATYGSFHTTSNFAKTNIGTGKWAFKVAATFNQSDNDYTFIDDRYTDADGNLLQNDNGNYRNYGVDLSLGYQIAENNTLSFFTTGYYANRFFSDGLPNPAAGSERNEDFNQRNLLQWNWDFLDFKQQVNLAYITQEYRYYESKDALNFNYGKTKQAIASHELTYKLYDSWKATSLLQFIHTQGAADVIATKTRDVFSFSGGISYNNQRNFITTVNFRTEANSDFNLPLSLSLAAEHKITHELWAKLSLSTNYRVPTYNEMYWPRVGNLDLQPEYARQIDIGFSFNNKQFALETAFFYIEMDDKIIWLPSVNSNQWRPKNIVEAINKGLETSLFVEKKIDKSTLKISGNYMYTSAKNTKTKKQLAYTPKHVLNYTFSYGFNRIEAYFQDLWQSMVYTNEIGIDFYSLQPVRVVNLGMDYKLFQRESCELVIGGKLNNLFNKVYYFTNLRPMPGKNYTININYKF
ncbi:MAG: TonB-dependent receptor plug domain-containing protein [Flavicella sp.]